MDNKISKDFIHQSQLVMASMRTIEGELTKSPLSDRKFHALTQKLHAAEQILHRIKERSTVTLFAKIAIDALEKEYMSLCGRVNDEWIKNKMSRIQNHAARVEDSMSRGEVTAKAIQELACHLESFQNEYLPDMEDKRKLAQAKRTVYRAHAYLCRTCETECTSVPRECEKCELSVIDFEESEEVMDIAACIHFNDMLRAKVKYHQLSKSLKQRFLEHMVQLGGTPFTHVFKTEQALIALSYQLAGHFEGYSTRAHIDELFNDLSQILREEQRDPEKILFSLRSNESLK